MSKFCQVIISSNIKKETDKISNTLVKKKLVAGCLIIKGPSKFWWKKKIVKKNYYNIQCFTLTKYKKRIINEVEKISSEDVPIIAFFNIDGNNKFLDWIEKSL